VGYFTYRLFRDISLEQLKEKTEANLALYEPNSKGAHVTVTGIQGDGCSALLMGYLAHEEQILQPVGFQLGCIWMDVRYVDGDSWELSLMEGTKQLANHSVNPWAYETKVKYDERHIEFRIGRVCEYWPRQGETLRPYLLPWRVPITKLGRTRYVPRKGKANDTDEYCYGDANQIHDFLARFGIDEQSVRVEIERLT
jgi:hypothetical protein